MLAASTSFPSLEASSCMSFLLLPRWRLAVSLSVMCLHSCVSFSASLGVAGGAVLFLCSCWSSSFSFLFQVGLSVPPRLRGSPKVA
jgi:hypothetical protein